MRNPLTPHEQPAHVAVVDVNKNKSHQTILQNVKEVNKALGDAGVYYATVDFDIVDNQHVYSSMFFKKTDDRERLVDRMDPDTLDEHKVVLVTGGMPSDSVIGMECAVTEAVKIVARDFVFQTAVDNPKLVITKAELEFDPDDKSLLLTYMATAQAVLQGDASVYTEDSEVDTLGEVDARVFKLKD